MKIILTYPFLTGKGGMETVIKKVLQNTPDSIKMKLFLPGGSEDESWLDGINNDNVEIILHNHKNPLAMFLDTFKYIKAEKPNKVITMNNLQILPILMAKKFVKNMQVISWNHFSLKFTKANFLLKKCDSFLAISSGICDELKEMKINPEKIHLIYNPIDKPTKLIPLGNENTRRFIYVGRVQYKKQKNLAEMFEILGQLEFDFQLDIYGDGTKEEVNKLKNLAKMLGINSKINWHGWQKNVWNSIKKTDLLLFTSKYEGFPMAILEAIAHGIPVISSNCSSGPKDIVTSLNGKLYQLGNTSEAVKLLNDFYSGNLKFGSQEEIAKSVEKFYTENYIKDYFNIIQK
ncbi:glycosyltransferase [Ligilactobacillus cholophilus]|uniref:glycosyltransferase n=1 Tax=Ligilactobacillus cholophilus TaxID=3050131 RepID=UPI0025AFBC86|nr:glycosyltransferase [Ligilactobacillus cholophilus]